MQITPPPAQKDTEQPARPFRFLCPYCGEAISCERYRRHWWIDGDLVEVGEATTCPYCDADLLLAGAEGLEPAA